MVRPGTEQACTGNPSPKKFAFLQMAWATRLALIGWLAASLMATSCREQINDPASLNRGTNQRVSTEQTNMISELDENAKPETIRAGYGIASCHIGLPVTELGPEWERVPEPELADQVLWNRSAGMYLEHDNGEITAVDFQYLSNELERYGGTTEKGVSFQSTFNDVRTKYGDPSYVIKSKQSDFGDFPGKSETVISYVEQGIRFNFIEGQLASISVQSPQDDFDYDGFRKSLGSALTYIRKSDEE